MQVYDEELKVCMGRTQKKHGAEHFRRARAGEPAMADCRDVAIEPIRRLRWRESLPIPPDRRNGMFRGDFAARNPWQWLPVRKTNELEVAGECGNVWKGCQFKRDEDRR